MITAEHSLSQTIRSTFMDYFELIAEKIQVIETPQKKKIEIDLFLSFNNISQEKINFRFFIKIAAKYL